MTNENSLTLSCKCIPARTLSSFSPPLWCAVPVSRNPTVCMLLCAPPHTSIYPKWTLAIPPDKSQRTPYIPLTTHDSPLTHCFRRPLLPLDPRSPPCAPSTLRHLGQNLHSVHSVESGERHVLIMWCRSGSFREKHCPCCLLNRANQGETNNCVVGPTWRGYYSKL